MPKITSSVLATNLVKTLLVLAILVTHYETRDETARTMPLNVRHFYSENYGIALSLANGKGFTALALPDTPQARPVADFLRLQRESLTKAELDDYFKNSYQDAEIPKMVVDRTLDLRLAAFIWKIWGTRWSVLFRFYSILSTFVCFLIFLMARRLSGDYWAGCLASLCFAGSALEQQFATWSIRDVSPLWFAAIAFFWLICLTDRSRSKWWNFASIAALGAISLLGYGWRSDAYLLPPFLLLILIAWLAQKGRTLNYIGLAILIFVSGFWSLRWLTRYLGPEQLLYMTPAMGFHIADYGNAIRSNLFGLENSFEIPRDDRETYALVDFYWLARNPNNPPPKFLSAEYAVASRNLYQTFLRYDAFNWYRGFPRFYLNILGTTAFPPEFFPRGDLLGFPAAVVFTAAALPLCLLMRERVFLSSLYLFSIYYSVLFLLVLPEEKHSAMFLLPLSIIGGLILYVCGRPLLFVLGAVPALYYCAALLITIPDIESMTLLVAISVVGGIGIWWTIRLLRPHTPIDVLPAFAFRRAMRVGVIAAIGAICLWGAGYVTLYHYSRSERATYIRNIMEMAGQHSVTGVVTDKHRFTANVSGSMAAQGYLLKIKTGVHPGILITEHVREADTGKQPGSFGYMTTHHLYPNREQFYYVTLVPTPFLDDKRDYTCVVTLDGDAEFVSSTVLDLNEWRRPAFNTVFYEGESIPGSPKIDYKVASTELLAAADVPKYDPPERQFKTGANLRPATLDFAGNVARMMRSSEGSLDFPMSEWKATTELTQMVFGSNAIRVRTPPNRFSYAVSFSGLEAGESGMYIFELRYQRSSGQIHFGLLSGDGSSWLSTPAFESIDKTDFVKSLAVTLNKGDQVFPQISNAHPLGDLPSEFSITGLRCFFVPTEKK